MSKLEIAVRLYEMYLISEALRAHGGNQTQVARALGIHRNTLTNKIRDYGIILGAPGQCGVRQPPAVVVMPTREAGA